MLSTEYSSETVFLLNDEPDWSQPVTLRATVPAQMERGLTGREARRPLGETLRLELRWLARLDRAGANALRDALQALGDEPVLCPAWPFRLAGTAWAGSNYSAGLYIGWMADWSAYEIAPALADPTAWEFVAPLLWGKLANTPEVTLRGPVNARVLFEFIEDGDGSLALVPDAVDFDTGPALDAAILGEYFERVLGEANERIL